jgi:RNA polymerase sigma factor (sigma-70 family)
MDAVLNIPRQTAEQDRLIADAVQREQGRLRSFIRKRVADVGDAEDILQDVFFQLVESYRLVHPIEHVAAWLYRVARNRIIDELRKKRPEALGEGTAESGDEGALQLEDLLPSPDAGPEAAYARGVLLDELNAAIEELPEDQRAVFVSHEIDGRSFKELAAETGMSVNTLLARKHRAVLYLRRRLQAIFDEYMTPEERGKI